MEVVLGHTLSIWECKPTNIRSQLIHSQGLIPPRMQPPRGKWGWISYLPIYIERCLPPLKQKAYRQIKALHPNITKKKQTNKKLPWRSMQKKDSINLLKHHHWKPLFFWFRKTRVSSLFAPGNRHLYRPWQSTGQLSEASSGRHGARLKMNS